MTKLNDTSAAAERALVHIYRAMSPERKWLQLGQMYRDGRALHAAGVRLSYPDASPRDIVADWVARNLGVVLPRPLTEVTEAVSMDSLPNLRRFVAVLDKLGIIYALGGSMASSFYGYNRTTNDADLTVMPFAGREAAFAAEFGPDDYVSLDAIRDAHRRRASFNVILADGFKADLFIYKDAPFERSAMARRKNMVLPDAPDQPVSLYAAEDVILFKLRWYRLGNESSEQQWRDVLGVVRVQGERLDQAYLDHWAADLGVADLLARIRAEAPV